MNDRIRLIRRTCHKYGKDVPEYNRLSYKMLIWGMRRAKVKPEVVLDSNSPP